MATFEDTWLWTHCIVAAPLTFTDVCAVIVVPSVVACHPIRAGLTNATELSISSPGIQRQQCPSTKMKQGCDRRAHSTTTVKVFLFWKLANWRHESSIDAKFKQDIIAYLERLAPSSDVYGSVTMPQTWRTSVLIDIGLCQSWKYICVAQAYKHNDLHLRPASEKDRQAIDRNWMSQASLAPSEGLAKSAVDENCCDLAIPG